jgi:hypothetical protein
MIEGLVGFRHEHFGAVLEQKLLCGMYNNACCFLGVAGHGKLTGARASSPYISWGEKKFRKSPDAKKIK